MAKTRGGNHLGGAYKLFTAVLIGIRFHMLPLPSRQVQADPVQNPVHIVQHGHHAAHADFAHADAGQGIALTVKQLPRMLQKERFYPLSVIKRLLETSSAGAMELELLDAIHKVDYQSAAGWRLWRRRPERRRPGRRSAPVAAPRGAGRSSILAWRLSFGTVSLRSL